MKNYVRPEVSENTEKMENVALLSGEEVSKEAFVCPKASRRYTWDGSSACDNCPNKYWIVLGYKCKGSDGIAFNGK